jgi:hypothetical protein
LQRYNIISMTDDGLAELLSIVEHRFALIRDLEPEPCVVVNLLPQERLDEDEH